MIKELEQRIRDLPPNGIIKILRIMDGLTQFQLGEKIGINTVTMNQIECGKFKISKKIAEKLSAIFNVDISTFYEYTPENIHKYWFELQENNITQIQMAHKLKIHTTLLSQMLTGKLQMPSDISRKIRKHIKDSRRITVDDKSI